MSINEDLVLRKLWLKIGYLLVICVIVLTLIPDPYETLGIDDLFEDLSDKAQHLFAYVLLMGWFTQIYHSRKSHLVLAASFISMGVALEFLQELGQTRMFEVADMIANSTGVLLAWSVAYTRCSNILLYFEKRALNLH